MRPAIRRSFFKASWNGSLRLMGRAVRHRRRMLVLSPTVPYPPRDGFSLRVWNLYRLLAKEVDLTMACMAPDTPPSEVSEKFEAEGMDLQTVRAFGRTRLLSRFGRKLAFALRHYPVWTAGYDVREVRELLRDLFRSEEYDLVAMESAWLAYEWPMLEAQRAPVALTLHDLDSEKWFRQARLLPLGRKRLYYRYNASGFKRVENYLLRRVSMTFVASEREKGELLRRNGRGRMEVVPNGVDTQALQPFPVSGSRLLLFVGSLSYLPNADGVLFFAREVMPVLLSRFPDVKLLVVGRGPTQEVISLHGNNGVELVGEVPDVEPYYHRAAVCVVPLRAGSGTRIKVLEAMAYARPVVSTALGCEGLDVVDRQHLRIADDPQDIADAIAELLDAAEYRRSIGQKARDLVERKYSWNAIAERMFGHCVKLMDAGR